MRPLATLAVLAGTGVAGTYCEWHLDYYSRSRVNFSDNPWHFEIDPSCTSLSLSTFFWGAIDDAGAAALASGLRPVSRLAELSLGFNNIGDAGAVALAEAFVHTPQLQRLYLAWNNIGDLGAAALAGALKHTPLLEELNIFWNNLGEAGTKAIAEGLRHTPQLVRLNLAWNPIGSVGAESLAKGLRYTPQLVEMSLAWSAIGHAGADAIAGALEHTPHLEDLRLKWNEFGEGAASKVAEAVARMEAQRGEGKRLISVNGISPSLLQAARNITRLDRNASASDSVASPPEPEPPVTPAPKPGVALKPGILTCIKPEVKDGSEVPACHALVLASANYTHEPLSPDTLTEAKRVAKALGHLGFNVTKLFDGTRKKMGAAIKRFAKAMSSGAVGMIYFQGRALQFDGVNYLLPVEYSVADESVGASKAKDKAIAMSWIFDILKERRAAANLFVAHACHPGPFQTGLRGLAAAAGPPGTLLAFSGASAAAATGRCEAPSDTKNSAGGRRGYAAHLLSQLQEPGLPIEQVFKQVRQQVLEESDHQQTPWEVSSLTADLVLSTGRARPVRDAKKAEL
mmetsp:Transcript_12260/g.23053  ORF Transcript_12260/g.23053 Transcript_12260/m.23053 type:complete len:570 (-) Transcript_12260:86-1795(-)